MKTRELPMGENQAKLKPGKEGKSIRAIVRASGTADTTNWNILKINTRVNALQFVHRQLEKRGPICFCKNIKSFSIYQRYTRTLWK